MGGSIGGIVGGIAGTAIGGPIGGAIGSQIGGSLFGGGGGGGRTAVGGAAIPPFAFGGLTGGIGSGTLRITPTTERQGLISSLAASFTQQAGDIRGLIPRAGEAFAQGIEATQGLIGQVRPGFGALTTARVNEIVNRGAAARSDLRANLARRRVLGSSFANDVLGRFDQQLAQDVGEAKAVSFLEELDLTNRLIGQRLQFKVQDIETNRQLLTQAFTAERGADQVQLNELNTILEFGLALLGRAADIDAQNAQLEAQLAASGAGQAGFASGFGGGGGGLLSSLGSTANFALSTGGQSFFEGGFQNIIGAFGGAEGPGF